MAVCLVAVTALVAAGCKSSQQQRIEATRPVFQMRLALDNPSADSEQMTLITKSQDDTFTNVLNVQKTVLLDQTALQSAKSSTDASGQAVIEIKFTRDGAKRFAEVTRENIHKRLAIIIDGQLYEAPVIQTEILGGEGQLSGSFSKEEARELAAKINESLPIRNKMKSVKSHDGPLR